MIIGGGDGTVLFVVEDMIKYGCSTDNVTFGIIPLGTSNDFSNCMGWGFTHLPDLIGENLINLKK